MVQPGPYFFQNQLRHNLGIITVMGNEHIGAELGLLSGRITSPFLDLRLSLPPRPSRFLNRSFHNLTFIFQKSQRQKCFDGWLPLDL